MHNKFLAESLRLFFASLLSSLLAHRAPIWRADLICMRKSQNCPLHTHTWKWPPSSRRSHITQYQFYEFLVWTDKLQIARKKSINMKYLLTNSNAFLESRPNITTDSVKSKNYIHTTTTLPFKIFRLYCAWFLYKLCDYKICHERCHLILDIPKWFPWTWPDH